MGSSKLIMAGYPPPGSSYPYGGGQQSGYGQQPTAGYGQQPTGYGQQYGASSTAPPPSSGGYNQYSGGNQHGGYGQSPFAALSPSVFPPGTDPSLVACFQAADQDGSGLIDDMELQSALSNYHQRFSIRTVHLLMYMFTGTNVRKIGEL